MVLFRCPLRSIKKRSRPIALMVRAVETRVCVAGVAESCGGGVHVEGPARFARAAARRFSTPELHAVRPDRPSRCHRRLSASGRHSVDGTSPKTQDHVHIERRDASPNSMGGCGARTAPRCLLRRGGNELGEPGVGLGCEWVVLRVARQGRRAAALRRFSGSVLGRSPDHSSMRTPRRNVKYLKGLDEVKERRDLWCSARN